MPYTVTSSPQQYQVILESETTQVVTASLPENAEIVTVGQQGPPGPGILPDTSNSNPNRAASLAELNAAKAQLEAEAAAANSVQNAAISAEIAAIDSQITALQTAIASATGAAASSYERTFTAADLSIASILPITHGFNSHPSAVAIYAPDGGVVCPDDVKHITLNATAVYLESFAPLQLGNWTASLTK